MLDGSALYDEGRMDTLEKRSDELYKELYSKEWFGKLSRYDRILGAAGEAVKEFYWNTAGEIEARDTAARRRMSAEERKNTPPKLGDVDTVFADSGVSMEIDADSDTEILHLKDQLRAAKESLGNMQPVSEIRTNGEFPVRISDRRDSVARMLKSNKVVDRQGFGKIQIDENRIRKGLNYVKSPADLAAFEAIPAVLKRGIQINHHAQHKGGKVSSTQNVESWTFAAPVTINGKTGNVAVVVQKTTDMFYKAHKVLMPDGSAFVLDKITEAESGSVQGATASGRLVEPTNSASISSIRSTAGNSQEKSSGKASVEVSGINSRTAAELNDGKRRRRTVGNTKRDIMKLFNTDRANRADVERILNRNIGEMMAQGEIRGDALDTLVNELLQTGSVVSSSKNSPWIDEAYESIRSDLKGGKLYVSKDMWRELDAAEHYVKHALRNKDEDKELGDVYERVARQELDHCEMFHAQAVRLIREHGEAPSEAMRAVWEYEHDKIMERDAEIRVKLGLYDGR